MKKINVHYTDRTAYFTLTNYLKDIITSNSVLICIGTDRCIEDCFGPLVGTMLEEDKFFPLPVYGTLSDPIHALNINEKFENIKKMHRNSNIIAIDASLDDADNIGELQIRDIPITPGIGVGNKTLPEIGDISIIGIIDSVDNMTQLKTNRIRLNLPFEMAKLISASIIEGYNLQFMQKEQTG